MYKGKEKESQAMEVDNLYEVLNVALYWLFRVEERWYKFKRTKKSICVHSMCIYCNLRLLWSEDCYAFLSKTIYFTIEAMLQCIH
jgi:hypothetical protein